MRHEMKKHHQFVDLLFFGLIREDFFK